MLYRFTDEIPASQLDRVVAATLQRRLWINDADYPDLPSWGERLHRELADGFKHAMVAYNRRSVAGSVIFKQGDDPRVLNVRRIAIRPIEEGRGIASFLLRSAEVEAKRRFADLQTVRVDAKVSNRAIRGFLNHSGYTITSIEDLYGLGAGMDAIYTKTIS
jgi:GNAT superfamily N-acetyltransferase